MLNKVNQDLFSPWQTIQQNHFADKQIVVLIKSQKQIELASQAIDIQIVKQITKQAKNYETTQQMLKKSILIAKLFDKQDQTKEQKSASYNNDHHMPQLVQINNVFKNSKPLRSKTEKDKELNEIPSKIIKPVVSQPKYLNKNFINIISSYKQKLKKSNLQANSKIVHIRTIPSSSSTKAAQKRNFYSAKKVQNPERIKVDFRKLKETFKIKRNASIQTLIKAKYEIQKIEQTQQSSILKKYSIQNMHLNNNREAQLNNAQSNLQKGLIKFTGFNHKQDLRDVSSTVKSIKRLQKMINQTNMANKRKNTTKLQKLHVLDKLYDRFQ